MEGPVGLIVNLAILPRRLWCRPLCIHKPSLRLCGVAGTSLLRFFELLSKGHQERVECDEK
jgi:hypothetical protein